MKNDAIRLDENFINNYMLFADALMKKIWVKNENIILSPATVMLRLAEFIDYSSEKEREEILSLICPNECDKTSVMLRDILFGNDEKKNNLFKIDMPKDCDGISSKYSFSDDVEFLGNWKKKYKKRGLVSDVFGGEWALDIWCNSLHSSEDYLVGYEKFFDLPGFRGFVKSFEGDKYDFMALGLHPRWDMTYYIRAGIIGYLRDLYMNRIKRDVKVEMAEFSLEYDCDVSNALRELGVNEIFLDSDNHKDLKIDRIVQRTSLRANRRGTKKMKPEVGEFKSIKNWLKDGNIILHLNNPFVVAVVHKETGLPILIGGVYKVPWVDNY